MSERREHDDGARRASRMSLEAFADRKAVRSWHRGVEEHDGKWLLGALRFIERGKCGRTITGELWLHTPGGQQPLEHATRQGIVVDHQHW
jgi:hypothetical protein